MWILTYVGALFNGLTLLILGESVPIIPWGCDRTRSSLCWWHEAPALKSLTISSSSAALIGVFSCPIVYEKHQVSIILVMTQHSTVTFQLSRQLNPLTCKSAGLFVLEALSQQKGSKDFVLLHFSVCIWRGEVRTDANCVFSGSDRSLRGSGQQPGERRGRKVSGRLEELQQLSETWLGSFYNNNNCRTSVQYLFVAMTMTQVA